MVTRIREKGQITIPLSIRQALKLSKDSILSVAKIGDAIVLSPQISVFDPVSDKFSKEAKKQDLRLIEF